MLKKNIRIILSLVILLVFPFPMALGASVDAMGNVDDEAVDPSGEENTVSDALGMDRRPEGAYALKNRLNVATAAGLIHQGDYFDVSASFAEVTATNAVSVMVRFDPTQFDYTGNTGADASQPGFVEGVSYLTAITGEGFVKLTLMIQEHKARKLINLRFKARADAPLKNGDSTLSVEIRYVVNHDGFKSILDASGTASATTQSGIPGDL